MSHPGREPEPIDNAGLAANPWKAATQAEIEAARATLRERVQRDREAARDAAWHRYAERPFPGGPLTVELTSREAAELSGALARAWEAMWDMNSGPDEWETPEADAYAGAMREMKDTLDGVEDETIVSGLRDSAESIYDFRKRASLEPVRAADAAAFSGPREPSPEADFEMEM